MTNEQKLFLKILEDFCHAHLSEKICEVSSREALSMIAAKQDLEGLLFSQCRRWWNDKTSGSKLSLPFLSAVFLSVNRADILQDILSECEKCNVEIICMKGAVFREYYPEPALRSMGDIDIIIHHEDRETMDRIMMDKIGCKKFVDNHAVWTYLFEGLMFEIHDHMFYEELTSQVDYRSYFDNVWEHCHHAPVFGVCSRCLFVPDEEFHFLYLMTHTAKHIIDHGCGFRAYLDMVMMAKAVKERVNWKHLEQELNRLELLVFTKTCFSCCEKWFGITMPMKLESESQGFLDMITEKTFDDGIFGLDNDENRSADTAKKIRRSSGPYILRASHHLITKMFPPYSDLQLVPQYSFVDGKPWLLPVAWVYRFGYCLKNKLKHSKGIILEPIVNKQEIKNRQEYLRQWGL